MSGAKHFSADVRDSLRRFEWFSDADFELAERCWEHIDGDLFRRVRQFKTSRLRFEAAAAFGCSVVDVVRLETLRAKFCRAFARSTEASERSADESKRASADLARECDNLTRASADAQREHDNFMRACDEFYPELAHYERPGVRDEGERTRYQRSYTRYKQARDADAQARARRDVALSRVDRLLGQRRNGGRLPAEEIRR